MLRKLLEERFSLRVHIDNGPRPVYAIVAAEGGIHLRQSAAPISEIGAAGETTARMAKDGSAVSLDKHGYRRAMKPSPDGSAVHLEISGATMEDLADRLSSLLDRPVIDATRLAGRYGLALDIPVQDLMNAGRPMGAGMPRPLGSDQTAASASGATSMFLSLKVLGLKLERRKAPLMRVIVDRCERTPTEK